jgi:hypothetical protein
MHLGPNGICVSIEIQGVREKGALPINIDRDMHNGRETARQKNRYKKCLSNMTYEITTLRACETSCPICSMNKVL